MNFKRHCDFRTIYNKYNEMDLLFVDFVCPVIQLRYNKYNERADGGNDMAKYNQACHP